jgi:hypothetical protein
MIRRGLFDSAARKGWRQAGFAANSFADECIYGFQPTVLGGHEHSVFQTGGSCTRPDRTLDDDDQVAADVRRGTSGRALHLRRSGQLPRDKKKPAVLNSDSRNRCEAISMVASSPHNSDPGIAVLGYSTRSDCK